MNKIKLFILILIITLGFSSSHAASFLDGVLYHPDEKWQMGFLVGTFLPRSISYGVQDQLGFTGMYFSHPTRLTNIEYIYMEGRDSAVHYMNAAIRFRIDFNYYKVFKGYMTLGGDIHRYKRAPTEIYVYDYINKTGIHGGFGFIGDLVGPWSLRSDVKFNIGPGKSLFVGVGLNYDFNSSSNEGT